ncbi:MAG: DUF1404 family protein [Thermoprotei archaeon]
MAGWSSKHTILFILGLAIIAVSANPLFITLEPASMPLKVTLDSTVIFGGSLVGYALFLYLFSTTTPANRLVDFWLRSAGFMRGVLYVWVIPAILITLWYTPHFLSFSLSSSFGLTLEVLSMSFAGLLAGYAWGAMSKTMRTATLFMVFFMSGTMGELLTEEGGVNVFFPANYPFYAQSQILYTGYLMWVISLIPVTYYAAKVLKDMGLY